MWWAKLVSLIFFILLAISMYFCAKYTYLYAKEENYEYDFFPFFMAFSARKYMRKAFENISKEDSSNKQNTRKASICMIICWVLVFLVDCILKLLGYI